MSLLGDLTDGLWLDWWLGIDEPEEVRKKRKEYLKARREAHEKALAEYRDKAKHRLAVPSLVLPLEGSKEAFQAAVEQYAAQHRDENIQATAIEFPNGWLRSVKIERKGEK